MTKIITHVIILNKKNSQTIISFYFLSALSGEFMKKILTLVFSAAVFCFCASAQSSQKLTDLIATKNTTYGQVAYLCQVYSGQIEENADYEQAFEQFKESNKIKNNVSANTPITLSELSFICTKLGNIKGGLFYTIFPSPRYAFRELKAKGILPQNADPDEKPSGRDVIAVFNGCIPFQQEEGL